MKQTEKDTLAQQEAQAKMKAEQERKKEFDTICNTYGLAEEDSVVLYDWVITQDWQKGWQSEQTEKMNLLELCLILQGLEDSANTIKIAGVEITNSFLIEYIKLSLNKYLANYFRPDSEGKIEYWKQGSDCHTFVKLQPKERLEGMWKDFDFYQPFSPDEIQKIRESEENYLHYSKIWEGNGENIPFLGDKAIEAFASIPKEYITKLSKTDLYNLIAETMGLAGLLDNYTRWKATENKLKSASKTSLQYYKSAVRNERMKMVEYMLKKAIEARKCTDNLECGNCPKKGNCECARSTWYKIAEMALNRKNR